MIINFSRQNEIKIDSVCNALKKSLPNSSFTRGAFRDFVVDTILSELSESEIESLINYSVKKVG